MALGRNLATSRAGRGLRALHDSPLAAAAVGVPTAAYKVRVFVLSAVYASLAGSLYAHYYGIITPKTCDIFRSVELVTMCLVGGMGSLWGGFFGAAFLTPLPQLLHVFEEYKDIFFGGVLLLLLIFQPEGLVGWWTKIAARAQGGRS
jgi:branched-chain amino acid transport system permease protein